MYDAQEHEPNQDMAREQKGGEEMWRFITKRKLLVMMLVVVVMTSLVASPAFARFTYVCGKPTQSYTWHSHWYADHYTYYNYGWNEFWSQNKITGLWGYGGWGYCY